jgi:4-amino-4-deoxy-L-arabinose transferase-like glycosyltransferase
MSTTKQRLLVFLVPLFLSLPFINRAYFVDDSYFVEIASWLKDHPTQPYHFRADDAGPQNRGWEENGFVRMVNPLAHQYYLAFLLKVGGEHEWFLRLGGVLLSSFAALFVLALARRWTIHPLLATLLFCAVPAQWLTAHSLLIDSTLGFLFLMALYFFMRGLELDSIPLFLVSGAAMGLAFLTKYPSLFLLPLTGLWFIFKFKKVSRRWPPFLAWAVGLAIFLLYQMWTAALYGRPHVLAASERMLSVFGWPKILVFFVFFSGSTLLPLLAWPLVGRRRILLYGIFTLGLTFFFASARGGFAWPQAFLLSLWTITTLLFLLLSALSWKDWVFPRDHFVFAWIAGFFLMMFVVMGWVAARYYTIVVPAIVLATVRLLEMKWPEKTAPILRGALVCLIVMGGALGYADYRQAEPMRRVGQELKEKGFSGGERHFFLGDSFISSYLKTDGWVPCFPETELKPGDWVLTREVTMPLIWFYRKPLKVKELARFEYPTSFPIKVMHFRGSAGWYASVWGALPFTITSGPWERFRLLEIEG